MLSDEKINELLQNLTAETKAIFKEKLNSIILFGSYARGDFDSESDIDILVIANISAVDLCNYRNKIDEMCGTLLFKYGIVVSVIEKDFETYNKYKNILPLYKTIETEGRRIA